MKKLSLLLSFIMAILVSSHSYALDTWTTNLYNDYPSKANAITGDQDNTITFNNVSWTITPTSGLSTKVSCSKVGDPYFAYKFQTAKAGPYKTLTFKTSHFSEYKILQISVDASGQNATYTSSTLSISVGDFTSETFSVTGTTKTTYTVNPNVQGDITILFSNNNYTEKDNMSGIYVYNISVTYAEVSTSLPAAPTAKVGNTEISGDFSAFPGSVVTISGDGQTTAYKINGVSTTENTFVLPDADTQYTIYASNELGDSESPLVLNYTVKAPEAINLSYNGTTIEGETFAIPQDQSVNISAEGATSFSVNDKAIEAVDGAYTYTVSTFDTPITFTAKNSNGSLSRTVTFSKGESVVYEKVTSTDGLIEGAKYIIVCESKDKALKNSFSTYAEDINVTIDKTNHLIENPSYEIAVFTLKKGETDGTWKWYIDDTQGLSLGSSSASLKLVSKNITETSVSFSTDASAGNVLIANSDLYIKYNASSTRFSTYALTSQIDIQLYRLQEPSDFRESDGTYTFGGSARVIFAYGDEVWLELGDSHLYALLPGTTTVDDYNIATNNVISDFNLNAVKQIADNYFEGFITSAPAKVLSDDVKQLEIIDAAALTDDDLGKGVRIHGTVNNSNSSSFDLVNGDVTYKVIHHFKASSANNASAAVPAQLRARANANAPVWYATSDDSFDFEDEQQIYVSGMVAKQDNEVVLYALMASENGSLITDRADIELDNTTISVVGNSVIIPNGAALFTLAGQRIAPSNVPNGIYIVRLPNGSAQKISVK